MSSANKPRAVYFALLAIPVLMIGLVMLQRDLDTSLSMLPRDRPELLLRSGTTLKRLSLGYDPLLADIYWTRVVQYYGSRVGLPKATFNLLGPLLDITTTLDPKLMIAYRFGAIFLSEPGSAGAGRADLAVDLVKKGIAANPEDWRLYQDLGLIYSIHLKDYQKASEAYLQGSKIPQAPIYMKVLAAVVAQKGDEMETSKLIWGEVYATTQDKLVRQKALEHLQALDAELDLKRLNQGSEDYWRKFGRYPTTIQELRDAGLSGEKLQDPTGHPYVMGPNGVPQLDPQSPIVLDLDKKIR
jgi:tetratricopeptide (TPR) repeat protein